MRKAMSILFMFIIVIVSACSAPTGGQTSSNNPNNATALSEEGMPLDETKGGKKTVVVSMLAADDFYLQAKQKYEAQHPNTTIQFKEFPAEGATLNPAEVERYIKQISTEVLSGKGADLYAVSTIPLPIDKYVNKKAFVNLEELIKRDKTFDPNLYQMNIIENSRMNNGIYTLPLQFYMEALFGDAANIGNAGVTIDDKNWTWSEFAEISKKLADKGGHSVSLANWAPELLLNNLVSDNYPKLVNGQTASFDSAFFTDLLKQVKSLYDNNIIKSENVDSKKTNFTYSIITSPSDYLLRLGLYYSNGKIYQKPHSADQQSGVSFSVTRELAMNANSKVKGEAWNFMKFLMSEEIQSLTKENGISINKAVNDKAVQDLVKQGSVNNPKAGKALEASEENLQPFKEMVSEARLRDYGYNDEHNKLSAIITEEAKAFFTGQKTAEATAKLMQNRIMSYLNE
ncbi:ABC transporter substrate-binding protein [Paenibacillus tuaregi]|uniref:ABC transporter substrate-binding protein n=1 Tax=Paenibacillus tuaregi TaxID=1816681 RepID=UPI0009EF07EA|nr:ABC transporter substrate-binding protein [Paenibacillus tuaregi]